MAETSNSFNKPETSNDPSRQSDALDYSSDANFWFNVYSENTTEEDKTEFPQEESTTVWPLEWGHVVVPRNKASSKGKKRKKKMGGFGSSSSSRCVNCSNICSSDGDLSGNLSALSAALSLSSSASSHCSSREELLEAESLCNLQGFHNSDDDYYDDDDDQEEDTDNSIESLHSFGIDSLPSELNKDVMLASNINGNSRKCESTSYTSKETETSRVPQLGMIFSSDEEAYNFYKDYAKQIGFNVRKGKVQRLSDGTIRKRYFLCSREGLRLEKQCNKKTKYKKKETRTGCNARIQCTVENGKWVVSHFTQEHNHQLKVWSHVMQSHVKPSETQSMIRRKTDCEKVKDDDGDTAAKYLEFRNLHCSSTCAFDGRTNRPRPEDVQSLINYLAHLQVKDPSFFYAVQIDACGRLTNFFWRDGGSRRDYEYFNDVLILDTTFRIDKYGMIYAPFVGLNHHCQYILFGCALLLDQSTDSFTWLLRTFVEAMGRKQPKTIFTDEGEAMADAIKIVLPETCHRVGVWFIQRNALTHLPTCCGQTGFQRFFNECIFGCQTREEFESKWDRLLEQFNLRGNSWISSLYMSRERWSDVFSSKKAFQAGIHSGPRIKHIFQNLRHGTTTCLSIYVKQYQKVVARQRRKEQFEDFINYDNSELAYKRGMENQAMKVYTSTIFTAFQQEMHKCLSATIEEVSRNGTIATFKVAEGSQRKGWIVELNYSDQTVTCSCMKFELDGFLCVHALKALNAVDISLIPTQYILKRWTRSAKSSGMADGAAAGKGHASRVEHNQLNAMTNAVGVMEGLKTIADGLNMVDKRPRIKELNLHPTEEEIRILRQENQRLQRELQRALETCHSSKMQLPVTSSATVSPRTTQLPRPTQSSLSLPPLPPSPRTMKSVPCPSPCASSRSSPSSFKL